MTRTVADMMEFWMLPWRVGETMVAAGQVVARRTHLIGAAMIDPAAADHAELARMAPEKVAAFGAAGSAMMADMFAWRAAMLTAPHRAAGIAARAPGRALRPVHRAATGNARRLGRPAG